MARARSSARNELCAAGKDSTTTCAKRKAKFLGEKAELLKEPTELAKKRDDYVKNQVMLVAAKAD